MTKKTTKKKTPKLTKRKSVKNKPVSKTPRKRKRLTTSKIICSKCKTEKKTTKQQVEKLVLKFGSLEDVHDKYHCIECRRKYNVRKDGKSKPIRKKRVPKKNFNDGLPEWMCHMGRKGGESYTGSWKPFYWKRPEGVTNKKWINAVNNVLKWGTENGILIEVNKPT